MNSAAAQSNNRQDTAFDIKAGPTLLSAATFTGDDVCNMQDEKLGAIQGIMLDMQTGGIRYALLSSGGFLIMGERLLRHTIGFPKGLITLLRPLVESTTPIAGPVTSLNADEQPGRLS